MKSITLLSVLLVAFTLVFLTSCKDGQNSEQSAAFVKNKATHCFKQD